MKKKILIVFLLSFILVFASCKRKATIEVGNEGNVDIEVIVAGYKEVVPANTSSIFEITWNSVAPGSWRIIDLMAKPVEFDNYFDSKTITVYDGDYYYWGTGWVLDLENKFKKTEGNLKKR